MTASPHHLAADATPACLEEVHRVLHATWAEAPQITTDQRTRFTVVVAELVANVIEHGGVGRPQPPTFELTVEVRGDAVNGLIVDDGLEPPRGAPGGRRLTRPEPAPAQLLDPVPHPDEIAALRESGRGLLLIRSSADDLALTRDGAHNRWRFVVRPRVNRLSPG